MLSAQGFAVTEYNQIRRSSKGSFSAVWKRSGAIVQYVTTKARRNTLLDELEKLNKILSNFLQHEDYMEQRPSNVRARKLRVGLGGSLLPQFWKSAERLRNAVQKSWCCPCRDKHSFDMIMQHPPKFNEVQFKLLFIYCRQDSSLPTSQWTRREMEVVAVENHPEPNITEADEPSRMRVKFARSKKSHQSTQGLEVMMKAVKHWVLTPTQPEEIKDLCHTIATRARHDSCLGVLLDENWQFSISRCPSSKQKNLESASMRQVTFEELLCNPPRQLRLDARQRHSIALAMASAYLQLHASPWIRSGWRRQDVYFWYDETKPELHEQPQIAGNQNSSLSSGPSNQDESIWSLGIALIEIYSGCALRDQPSCRLYLTPDALAHPVFECAAAKEWCGNAEGQLGTTITGAIFWCLRHSAIRGHMDLNDREWRENLLTNVVEPISRCYECLFGKSASTHI